MLQHTKTHFYTLQHTATHCNTLQHTATHCRLRGYLTEAFSYEGATITGLNPANGPPTGVWKHTAEQTLLQHYDTKCRIEYNALQHTATHCNTLQHTATHCNTLQHTATHRNTLQYTAIHYNTGAFNITIQGQSFGDNPQYGYSGQIGESSCKFMAWTSGIHLYIFIYIYSLDFWYIYTYIYICMCVYICMSIYRQVRL